MSAAERLEQLVGPLLAGAILDALREELAAALDETCSTTPRWLTVEQTAGYLGTTPKAVRRRIDRGRLPSIRDGRRVYVDRHALDDTYAGKRRMLPTTTEKAPATRERPGARPQEEHLP